MTNIRRTSAGERRRLIAKRYHYRVLALVAGMSGLSVAKPINPAVLLKPTRTEQQQACHWVYQPMTNLERFNRTYDMIYHFADINLEPTDSQNKIDLYSPLAVTTIRCTNAFQAKQKEPVVNTFDDRIFVWISGGAPHPNESKKWSAELVFKDEKGQEIARWMPNIQQEGDLATWSKRFNPSDGWTGQNTYVFQLEHMPKILSTKLNLIKTVILVTNSPLGLCSFPIDSEPRVRKLGEWEIDPRPGECQQP